MELDLNDLLKELGPTKAKKESFARKQASQLKVALKRQSILDESEKLPAGQRLPDLLNLEMPEKVGNDIYLDAIVAKIEEEAQWKATAQVVYIDRQECLCCGNMNESVIGYFTRQKNRRMHAERLVRQHDLDHECELPRTLEYYDTKVAQCVGCLRVEQIATDLLAAFGEIVNPHQLDLWKGAKHETEVSLLSKDI